MDLVGSAGNLNQGGHFAHIGGAVFGMIYVYLLRKGTDLASPFVGLSQRKSESKPKSKPIKKTSRSKFKVIHNSAKTDSEQETTGSFNQQTELDRILDKINVSGYDKLTAEEKDFLYRASKKK